MSVAANRNEQIARIRTHLQQEQQALRAAYLSQPDAIHLLGERCRLIDDTLRDLWQELKLPSKAALIAVGGYGRGELYPASDIDLLLLLPEEPGAALAAKIEQLVGIFWDIGLEIGHSVRTIDECLNEASGDITIQTALLETRLLTGSKKLFTTFQQRVRELLNPRAFFKAKKLEQDERYLRFQETPYSLEPNCKESPGGLRDLQIILWVANAAGLGKTWPDLAAGGFITAEELTQIEECEAQLRHIRIRLHLLAGRREDRLLFDVQGALAEEFGFSSTPERRNSEFLMQLYYKTAKTVTQLNTILLQNIGAAIFPACEQAPQPINERFQITHELLDIRDDDVFERTPSALLEAFRLMQAHPELKDMTARTLRMLWRARRLITPEFRADPHNRQQFVELFQSPQGVIHEFRRLNKYGILGRYLPAFGKIVGQMQHDLFHVYTVDQHIMMVMRNLRRFSMHEFAHEYPLCSRLIADFDRHWLLYVAALFHDIAKGRGGDHSELGTVDAQEFCAQHGLSAEDSELVVWIVRQHLQMSQVAQKEDLSDPAVIAAFAAKVGDDRHLTALYLFTVADIRGTSHKVWNAWKSKLLEDLFKMTRHQLNAEGGAPEAHGVIHERQQQALALLRYFALSGTVHERLWKQLDTAYFLRHSAEEIAWHTRNLHYRTTDREPIVRARLAHAENATLSGSGGIQVMVYTQDQPDLFLRLCGFFGRAGYSIADAKIHTTQHGYALDSFVLLDVSGRDADREMVSYIEHELTERLKHQTPPEGPLKGRLSRQVKHFPYEPKVAINADEKNTHYILSLTAADRPGLLYSIAQTLTKHGSSLHAAKIATLGERVEDTFVISGNLEQSSQRIKLESELLEMLQV
jgi:[protein-PII] uridylyltransferase